MTTPRELLARYVTQSQMSSFFIDKMGIINVKSYGAKGDGVTDDTVSLNLAIATAFTNNVTFLYYPPGIYKVTSANLSANFGNIMHVGDNAFFNGSTAVIKQTVLDRALSPEDFTGNAKEKIEAAITQAIVTRQAVNFNKMYDITGLGTIVINKLPDFQDRNVLMLLGDGGGIIKNDAGYIFTAPVVNVGDIRVHNMRFQSTAGAGTKVWNCNNIIRLFCHSNNYRNVDTIAEAETRWFQSCHFDTEHITGGLGWAFTFKASFDTTFVNCLIEHRQHGIRNNVAVSDLVNRNLRIQNNLLEGMTGTSIQLASCWGCVILGNYFEYNQGNYIDLQTLVTGFYFHYALSVMGNMISLTDAQISNEQAAILVGSLGETASGGENQELMQPNIFIGNTSNGILFNKNGTGHIITIGNYTPFLANMGNTEINLTGLNRHSTEPIRSSGIFRALKFTASVALVASESKKVTIPISTGIVFAPVKDEDAVTIYVDEMDKVSILGYKPSFTSVNLGKVDVFLQNRDAVNAVTANLTIVVYKIFD